MFGDILYRRMVAGIIESGINEDGGPVCYAEIPKGEHVFACIVWTIISGYFFFKWNNSLINVSSTALNKPINPTFLEKAMAWVGILTLVVTLYLKLVYGKGVFIVNPCHATFIIQIVLLLSPSTTFMHKMHTAMTAWLFGAMLALMFPHLEGVTPY